MKSGFPLFFPLLCLLASCMPEHSALKEASFALPLKQWPQLAEHPQVSHFLLALKGYSTIILDKKEDSLDAFRLEYPGDRYEELVKKCSGRFENPKIQTPAVHLAVWSLAECDAVLMISYEKEEDLTRLIFIKRRHGSSFQCPYFKTDMEKK